MNGSQAQQERARIGWLSLLRGVNSTQAPSPSGSVSSKISRTRSLPSKIFTRRISHEYGRIFRRKPLLEDGEVIDEVEEYERLVELEKQSHAKEHSKLDYTRSCIASLRGSREEINLEAEEDDGFVVAAEDQQQDTVGTLNGSPVSLSRSSSLPAHCVSEAVDVALVAFVVEREPEIPVVDLPGSPRNSESTHSDLVPAAEFVDNPLQVESLKVDSVSNLEVACSPNGESEGNFLIVGDEDIVKAVGSVGFHFTFQAQSKPKTWRRLKRIPRDQESLQDKMPGKGKVSLSFNTPGKQPRRHSFTDARDFVWDSRDVFGKRLKDDEEDEDVATDIRPGSFGWGLVGHTNPLLNYDPGYSEDVPDVHYGRNKGWSAKQTSRGTALALNVRGLGGSPKPVTSLESCLRAQMADALTSNRFKGDSLIQNRMNSQMVDSLISNRASRPLYFSTVDEDAVFDEYDLVKNTPPSSPSVLEKSISVPVPAALPKLPNLSKFLKEYAAKLSRTESGRSESPSRRQSRANDQTSTSPNDSNRLEQPSYETVLFSFGVGLGVLLASGNHEAEVKRLMELLNKTQADLENVKMELARRKSPPRTNRSDAPTGIVRKGQHSVRSDYSSEQQEDQMAELEAELEAELDQLTGGDSATIDSQSTMDELEVDASVVFGDLEPAGLPARVEDDSNEDQTPPAQPASLNNYAVSPRELSRLLRKLQTSRQHELIAELEEDLNNALSKLESRENELEMWKERVKRLTKVSFVPASEDDDMPPRVLIETTVVSTPARNIDLVVSQDCVELPMQEHGLPVPRTSLVEESNSHPSSGPVAQGDLKQKPGGIGRQPSDGGSEKDCKPILDNAQIITQLIDSVQGLEYYGDHAESVEMGSTPSLGLLSSSVSLDKTPEKLAGRGLLLPRANPVVPHPSRRTSYNSDSGNPVLIRKPSENDTSELRNTESSKSLSDMSEATEIPYSVKYIDSTIKPAAELEVAADENSSFWVGHAGMTTPVEKPVRQQLFSEQAQSVRLGEVSPTVLEKVTQWEGLMEGETPGPATGSDWECQSQASELEQDNVFSEDNLVSEAEEMLGRMLIKRIVEKSRLGSESLVKKAQSALATLERDEVDAYHGIEDDFMNERSETESERSEEQQQSGFLDEAVRKEYEFFRRLEIINKDRKALKVSKEIFGLETPDAGAVALATIPVPALNASLLSPASQPPEVTVASKKDAEVQQSNGVGKENNVKQSVESNSTGRENWFARPDTFRARSGYREDEVRSRRRS